MRIIVLDTYYPPFLREHYRAFPGLLSASYEQQIAGLMARSFSTSDGYSHNLRALGHEAAEVVANCVPLQARWAIEYGMRTHSALMRPLIERVGRLTMRLSDVLHRIVVAQVEAFAPDVVYIQDIGFHTTRQVRQLRERNRLVVGQLASQAPRDDHLRAFDLITTSFPHFVERFRKAGVCAEYFRIGFDERVLERLRNASPPPVADVVFVGGLAPRVHGEGVRLLERICVELGDAVDVYGYGASKLPTQSPILERFRGEAWGLDMYRALAGARIALNRHIAAAEGHANNMRLYEATGVGSALITDRGRNLADLFEPGREVATYADADELIDVTRSLLADEPRRTALAAAGQARTLGEHTYANRMKELVAILEERLTRRRPAAAYRP